MLKEAKQTPEEDAAMSGAAAAPQQAAATQPTVQLAGEHMHTPVQPPVTKFAML